MPKKTSASETQDTYYWQHREKILLQLKQKYQQDEAYREATRRRARERYHQDKAYQAATYQRALARYYHRKAQTEAERPETPETKP